MNPTEQIYPVNINSRDHDYYREGAVIGQSNPYLPIGFRMYYTFNKRANIKSPGVSCCETLHMVVI